MGSTIPLPSGENHSLEKRDHLRSAGMTIEGPVNTASFHSGRKLIGLVSPSNLTHLFRLFFPTPNPALGIQEGYEGKKGGGAEKEDDVSGSH